MAFSAKKDANVVGPGLNNPPTIPGADTNSSTKPVTVLSQGTTAANVFDTSKIDSKLKNAGINIQQTTGIQGIDLVSTLTPDQTGIIGKVLKKRGYTVKASVAQIKGLLATQPELIAIAAKAKTYNELLSGLAADYIPSLGKDQTAANVPSRSIYKYTDEAINTMIDDIYKTKLMRPATAEEKAMHLASAKPLLEQGTVSTTKLVKNPKTGVVENVTTQEAGPTKETVTKSIEDKLKELNPDDYDRAKRIEFSSWVSQNMAGA